MSSRRAAAELLMRVLEKRRTLDDALIEVEAYDALEGSDRGFARAMASAALRQLGRINTALQPLLDRPLETATPPVRALLQIGAAQIWLLDTPVHAAVGETVEVAKGWPAARRAAGFINAVLRKLPVAKSEFDALPPDLIWPSWFRQTLLSQFSAETVAELASVQMGTPQVHLTAKDGDGHALAKSVDGEWLTGPSVAVQSSDVTTLPGYDEGNWWVQDVAAALPANLLALSPNEAVVDLCAAPGGKTMQLAASGVQICAIDRSKPRLKRVEENLSRTSLVKNVQLIAARGEDWEPSELVDAVLVDAPCSAMGTLRRHPEGPWIKQPEDIVGYGDVQKRLLQAGLSMLKPGGRLIYCVCSPLKHEGVDVVEAVLATGVAIRSPIAEAEIPAFENTLTTSGDMITLPSGKLAHDAFFISRLTKNA